MAVSRKRIAAWGILLTMTLSVRVTVAAPRAAAEELRAAACCIEHCPPAQRRPMQAKRCCGLGSDASDPGTLSPVAHGPGPDVLLTSLPAPPAIRSSDVVVTLASVAMTTGPPPYRRTQKLQR